MKKLFILLLAIAIISFFSIPSLMFADEGDEYTALGEKDGQYELEKCEDEIDDENGEDNGEEDPCEDEIIVEAYCLDKTVQLDPDECAYQETDTMVSDELEANGVEKENAEAVEIIASTATGASNEDNQEAVWEIIEDDLGDLPAEEGDSDKTKVKDAAMTLAEEYVDITTNPDNPNYNPDLTLEDFKAEKNINDLEVTLDDEPLVDENGDYVEHTATAIMEEPFAPGVTDGDTVGDTEEGEEPEFDALEGKSVFWYILEDSYNVSFSETDLVTETTSTMYDYKDDADGNNSNLDDDLDGELDGDDDGDGKVDGDNYGMATVPYYFYWWGEGYPEYEEMNANIGACVDIDEDGDIDKEDGADLEEFEENIKVVQTTTNDDYIPPCSDDYPGDGPYNSPNKVEEEDNDDGEVVTENPENVDIDCVTPGKMVVEEEYRSCKDNEKSVYEDVWVGGHYTGRYWYYITWIYTGWTSGHYVNGAPSVTIPEGYYGFWCPQWHDEEIVYPDPYKQRFATESYSEPCATGSGYYEAYGRIEVNKTDSSTGDPIPGVEYQVTYISGQTQDYEFSTTITTDSNGFAELDGLKWGTYEIVELTPGTGYVADTTVYSVDIGGTALFEEGTLDSVSNFVNSLIPPSGGGTTPTPAAVTVAAVTEAVEEEDEEEVKVLGSIEELPYTGMDPLIPISSAALIFAGLSGLAAIVRKKKK